MQSQETKKDPRTPTEKIRDYNSGLLKNKLPMWLTHARENAARVNEIMRKDHCVTKIPAIKEKDLSRIFIIGSGPSLKDQRDLLPLLKPYLTLCNPSSYPACRAYGLTPDIVFASDPHQDTAWYLNHVIDRRKTVLAAEPTLHPDTLAAFPVSQTYLFKSNIMLSTNNPLDVSYNEFLNQLFGNIPYYISQAGCVTNQTVLYIFLLQELSLVTRFADIMLVGADYAFRKNAFSREAASDCFRVPLYQQNKDLSFTETYKDPPDILTRVVHQDWPTDTRMRRYKRNLYYIWLTLQQRLWRSSSDGILSALPVRPIDLFIRQDPVYQDFETWKTDAVTELASIGDGLEDTQVLGQLADVHPRNYDKHNNLTRFPIGD